MARMTRLRIVKAKTEEAILLWVNNLKIDREPMKIEIKGAVEQRKDGSYALSFILPEDYKGTFPLIINLED
jgi:hypothetical protein